MRLFIPSVQVQNHNVWGAVAGHHARERAEVRRGEEKEEGHGEAREVGAGEEGECEAWIGSCVVVCVVLVLRIAVKWSMCPHKPYNTSNAPARSASS